MSDLDLYTKFVLSTAKMSEFDTNYYLIGLGGEVGEVLNEFKKHLRGDGGHGGFGGQMGSERRAKLIDELGDVMWYLHATCASLGVSVKEVLDRNMAKLITRRAAEGEKRVANKGAVPGDSFFGYQSEGQ